MDTLPANGTLTNVTTSYKSSWAADRCLTMAMGVCLFYHLWVPLVIFVFISGSSSDASIEYMDCTTHTNMPCCTEASLTTTTSS